jgi:hypothetical protein
VRVKLHIMGVPPTHPSPSRQKDHTVSQASLLQELLTEGMGYAPSSSSSSESLKSSPDQCLPVVTPIGTTGFYEAQVCFHDLNTAKQLLAQHSSIQWVDVVHRKVLHNLMAGSAMQSGALQGVPPGYANNLFPDNPVLGDPRHNSSLRPLWAAGLDGSGQLVGVTDTGLDMDRWVSRGCYEGEPNLGRDCPDVPLSQGSLTSGLVASMHRRFAAAKLSHVHQVIANYRCMCC